MYSYENTYNEKTGEWHPHIHMFALVDSWIDQQEFAEYWQSLTGDSYIVDVRRAKKEKGSGYAGAAAEVCKYALKFGDLSVEKTWEAFKILKGRRLTGSFGLLWGVKIPEEATDELPDDQSLPYLEMLYKFNYAKQSYYDLIVTRNVEPKAKAELGGGGGASTTTDRRCEAEELATTDEAIIFGRGEGAQHVKMKRGRKKAHWRIPPQTRVRVRHRIHRWDGFLYNIDLFPYVERRLLAFIG